MAANINLLEQAIMNFTSVGADARWEKDFDLFAPVISVIIICRFPWTHPGMHPERKNGTLCPSRNGTTKSFGQTEFYVYSVTSYLKDEHKLKKRERI